MKDDAELLYAYARRGDVASLTALVERHSVWMQAFLRGLVGVTDADDVFQETWIRVIKSVASYRGGKVKAYLATIARCAAIDRMRSAKRTVSMDALEDERGESAAEKIEDEAPAPDEKFESNATAEDVRAAVAELPEGQRQVVLLRIEAEMAFKDIASELGVPLGTVLTWMRKATQTLKRKLGGAR